ncbi:hypothetical protein ACRAWD_06120 [Caulobacter segnis]
MLTALEVELVPVDEAQGREAIRARIAYGKGTGRTAQLELRRHLHLRLGQDARRAAFVRR